MTGIIGAIISSLGFGTANVVIKKSLLTLSIPQTLMMSTLSGIFFLFLFCLATGASLTITNSLIVTSALMACGEIALYLVFYKAYDESNVTVATALINTYPILATLFTVLFLGQQITPIKFLFISLMVLGAILTGIDWDAVRKNGFNRKDLVKGLKWIFFALLAHAIYFPLLGVFTSDGAWASKLLYIKIFSAVLVFLVFAVYKKQSILPPTKKIPFTSLLGLLEVIGWSGYTWATNNTTGQIAIIIAGLNSAALVTAVLAYFFLKEKLSLVQYAGIVVIIAGLTGLSL